jgi:GT2 family glycosyltransferase
MQIHIIIPVHNRISLTRGCLVSLRKQSDQGFRVIVVDDGSTDTTSEVIRAEFPEVDLLSGDGNLWWVGAVNKGLNRVLDGSGPDDCVLLLNNDLVIPSDFIQIMRSLALQFPSTLIGAVVADWEKPELIRSGGTIIDWKTAKWRDLNQGTLRASFPSDHYEEVSTLTGRGVLIPVGVFREIGLYKQHYVQCGDTELPVRAAQAGYPLIVHYSAIVYGHFHDENDINDGSTYGIADIVDYFWNIKSHADLRTKFRFAFDTSPSTLSGIRFWLLDLVRTTGHFVARLRFQ